MDLFLQKELERLAGPLKGKILILEKLFLVMTFSLWKVEKLPFIVFPWKVPAMCGHFHASNQPSSLNRDDGGMDEYTRVKEHFIVFATLEFSNESLHTSNFSTV